MVGPASCFRLAMMLSLPTGFGGSRTILMSVHGWDQRVAGSWLSDSRRTGEWVSTSTSTGDRAVEDAMGNMLAAELNAKGITILRDLVTKEQLTSMQRTFEARLRRVRWNNFDGYEKTEPYRHMVQDLLTLDQG